MSKTLEIKIFDDGEEPTTCCRDMDTKRCEYLDFFKREHFPKAVCYESPTCKIFGRLTFYKDDPGDYIRPHKKCIDNRQ